MLRAIAFLASIRAQKRLRDALAEREQRRGLSLQFAAGWEHAQALARSAPPDLLVFDPYEGDRLDSESIARFTAQFSACVLVAYSRFPHGCARDVLELSRAGVHAVATLDVDDAPQALAALLENALEAGMLGRAVSLLARRSPPPLRTLLPRALFLSYRDLTPSSVASLCHCHPKTLRVHLRRAGLPSLAKLVVWSRLIRACHLLRDPRRSVESVALALGFASANSFRNQVLRYLGVCPTGLREREDAEFVLRRFQLALKRNVVARSGSRACDPVLPACATGAYPGVTVPG